MEGESAKETGPFPETGARFLKLAKRWLVRARDNNFLGYRDLAMIASSISMFNAGRAILSARGVEGSDDLDLAESLKNLSQELEPHAVSLDQFGRLASAIQRDHEVSVGRSDVREAMDSAKQLIKLAERMLSELRVKPQA